MQSALQDKEELALIIDELEYRKKVNPLDFFENMPQQGKFGEDKAKTRGVLGGNRELAYGTMVKMADGKSKPIEDIIIGDYILAWNGEESLPTQVIDIPYDDYSECYKVTTASGLEVEGSKDHCFPIQHESNDVKRIMKMTLEESAGKMYKGKKFVCGGVQEYTNNDKLLFSGLLLGLYLGDGSSSKPPSSGYHDCNFTNTEKYIRDEFEHEISMAFPSMRCVYYPSDLTRIRIKGNGKGQNHFLNALKIYNLAGKKSNEKFIPDNFKYNRPSVRREIVRGIILTDGGVDRYKTTIWSNSIRMLNDIEEIIISLGGRSKTYKDKEPANENQNQQYKLQFSNKILEMIGVSDLGRKEPKVKIKGNARRDDLLIKTISHTGVKKCRCLTVEHPSHTFVLANGIVTYNSGKTEKLSEYVIRKCITNPNIRVWACAETFTDSVNVQQRKIWALMPKNEIKYGTYTEVNGFTNRKLIFKNGSIIIFKSFDQGRESFQSDDIDIIWNDEEVPYDIYREQRMRLIDRNGEMLFSMTSLKGVTDLIQEIFEEHDVIKSRYAPLVDEELPLIVEKNGMKFYMLWTTDNPYIDQERVLSEAKLMPRQEIKSRIYGLPVNLSGKIYMSFNKDIHVIPFERLPFTGLTLYHVLDPHDRKPWAMQWWIVDKTGTGYCIDEYPDDRNFNEILFDDKTYKQYAQIIRDKEETLRQIFRKTVHKRIIDPNFGNKTVQLAERQGGQSNTTPKKELEKLGLMFDDAIDSLEIGHLKVREVLYWEEKKGEIVVQPQAYICDNCTNTIRHLSRYSRKDIMTSDGDVKNSVKPKEKYKDFSDLIRYFWMSNPKHVMISNNFEPVSPNCY